jgi:enoyl-CoA hydratase/carnithine racemase
MSDVHIRLHKQFLWLVLNRPPHNNLTLEMLEQLAATLTTALAHPPRLLVITGAGEEAFCSGIELPDESDSYRAKVLQAAEGLYKALEALRAVHVPTVALVKGHAFGPGCELAALCDTVIAHDKARFRLPAVNAKVFTAATSVYLPAALGQEVMTKLMQSGQTLNAREALRLGLVQQVLPDARFLPDTEELLVMLSHSPSGEGV